MQLNELKTIFFETDGTPLANALGGLNIHVQLEKNDKKDADADFQPIVVKYICSYDSTFDSPGAKNALNSYVSIVGKDKAKIEEKYDDMIGNISTIQNAIVVMTQKFSYGIESIPEVVDVAKGETKSAQAFLTALIEPVEIVKIVELHKQFVKETLTTRSEAIAATLMKRANTQAFSTESVQQIKNYIASKDYQDPAKGGLTGLKNYIEQLFATFGQMKLNGNALARVAEGLGKDLGVNAGQQSPDIAAAAKDAAAAKTATKAGAALKPGGTPAP
jgi:hypothetical protein